MEVFEVKFTPLTIYEGEGIGNVTYVVDGTLGCMLDLFCPNCAGEAFVRLDFSILNTLLGFPEEEDNESR